MKDGGSKKSNYSKKLTSISTKTTAASTVDCNLGFTAPLQNLQPSLSFYSQDDILKVEISDYGFVIAKGKFGECGTVTSPETLALKQCIKDGNKYKATILEISKTSCKVRIRRAL